MKNIIIGLLGIIALGLLGRAIWAYQQVRLYGAPASIQTENGATILDTQTTTTIESTGAPQASDTTTVIQSDSWTTTTPAYETTVQNIPPPTSSPVDVTGI